MTEIQDLRRILALKYTQRKPEIKEKRVKFEFPHVSRIFYKNESYYIVLENPKNNVDPNQKELPGGSTNSTSAVLPKELGKFGNLKNNKDEVIVRESQKLNGMEDPEGVITKIEDMVFERHYGMSGKPLSEFGKSVDNGFVRTLEGFNYEVDSNTFLVPFYALTNKKNFGKK